MREQMTDRDRRPGGATGQRVGRVREDARSCEARNEVGEELVQLVAPDAEVRSPFSVALEVPFEGFASAYRYGGLDPALDPNPSAPPDSDAADTDGN